MAVNSLSGTLVYLNKGLVDRRRGLMFAAAAIPGSVLAPFVVAKVAGGMFQVLFGVLLLSLAAQMIVRPRLSDGSLASSVSTSRRITTSTGQVFQYRFNEGLATAMDFVLGFMSSFFGTGGGFLRTPLLVSTFGFPVQVAVATSIFTLSFYTTTGALTHASLGHVEWYPTFLWSGVGLVSGAQLGARLTGVIRGAWILRLLLIVVLAMGIQLLVEGLRG